MTTTSDCTKTIDNYLNGKLSIDKTTFDETDSILKACARAILQEFDICGALFAFHDSIWNSEPENQNIDGTIRPRPAEPTMGIHPGPRPAAIDPAAINEALLALSRHQHMIYDAAMAEKTRMDNDCIKFRIVLNYFKTSIINEAKRTNIAAYGLMVLNRNTGIPDINMPFQQIVLNLYSSFGTPDADTFAIWQSTFDRPRQINQPIMEMLATWNLNKTRIEKAGRVVPDDQIIAYFIKATAHDARAVNFVQDFFRMYPHHNKTWAQLIQHAIIQEPNLDGQIHMVQSGMMATTAATTTTTIAGGGTAAAATNTGVTTNANTAKPYCFIHGRNKDGHDSQKCKMIKINASAYPYDKSSTIKFINQTQIDQAKMAKSPKFEVQGIGKGKQN